MDDLSVRLSAVALTARVTLVHEPMMLGHVPPALADVKELPVRVAAIEAQLRGHADWQRFNDPHPLQVADEADLEAQHWGPSSPVRAASIKPAVLERRAKAQAESEPLDTLFGRDGGVGGPETLSTVAFPTQEAPLASSEWARCAIVRAPVAPVEWLLLVHSEKHLRNVARKTLIARGGALAFTDKDCSDLYFCPETLHAARLAAGGAVAAVQSLFPRDSGSAAAFAIVRPPGHHCGRERCVPRRGGGGGWRHSHVPCAQPQRLLLSVQHGDCGSIRTHALGRGARGHCGHGLPSRRWNPEHLLH